MKVIRSISELSEYVGHFDLSSCLADTGFLYAAAFDDDRLHFDAEKVFEVFSQNEVSVFANVISRMEFVDLIFRKQVTRGALALFEEATHSNTTHKNVWNILKNIRDQNAGHEREGLSYKVDESRIKKLRRLLEQTSGNLKWEDFCGRYVDRKLLAEWEMVEEDLGLNFLEVLEGQTSDSFHAPVTWSEMVQIMGKHGLRGPDAMIMNIFLKSRLPLLVTTDSDLLSAFDEFDPSHADKAILYLE